MHVYSFEKLEVWQKARELTKKVYILIADFPDEERYGLSSQLRRAVVSVASNIAEGSGRNTQKDQAYFTQNGYSSLMEVLCQLILAVDLKFLNEDKLKRIRKDVEEISNKLNALRKSQLSKNKTTSKRLNYKQLNN